MCLACLLLMLALCVLDGLGIPFVRGNPLPQSVQTWIAGHPEAVICGEVQHCAETEFSQSIYLKKASLLYQPDKARASKSNISTKDTSEKDSYQKVSIENVRVFLKKEKGSFGEEFPAGTLLKVSGRLVRVPEARNPGEFDSQQYYGCRHIYYFLKEGVILQRSESYSPYLQGLLDVRERFAGIFEQIAGKEAAVFEAMILGEKENLEPETKMRYQMAGIIHILAISGMHISLLGEGLYRLLKKAGTGIFLSGMISLAVMLQYGIMTGSSVAAIRAVCMFLLSVGAQLLGRCYDGMTALAVSAILLLLNSPANLYSSGFLLSFGAVLGLGIAAPVVCGLFQCRLKIVNLLLSSVSVQLLTLPVLLYFYGEVSLAGILLNLAVLPTVGTVLASGVCGGLLGLFSLKAAGIVVMPGRALLLLYDQLCSLAGKIPWCTWIGGQPKLWQIAVYYVLLFLALFLGKRVSGKEAHMQSERTERRPGMGRKSTAAGKVLWLKKTVIVLLICPGILILGWQTRDGLRITCLDVGQGDGIVVETPENCHFLIDCGSSNKSGVGQYQLLPYLKNQGISYLDGIFVSHTDEDHISGIRELLTFIGEGLTSLRAGTLYLPGWSRPPEAWMELTALAEKAGVRVTAVNAGDVLKAGSTSLTALSPQKGATGQDVNEEAMVLQLEYSGFRALFTGDIGEETERKLLNEGCLSDVDFLKVGHHGSRYSSGSLFLQKIRPEIGVISCSSTNTYGHPSPETIERLEAAGCRLEYTMNSGAVTFWTDGKYRRIRWQIPISFLCVRLAEQFAG